MRSVFSPAPTCATESQGRWHISWDQRWDQVHVQGSSAWAMRGTWCLASVLSAASRSGLKLCSKSPMPDGDINVFKPTTPRSMSSSSTVSLCAFWGT